MFRISSSPTRSCSAPSKAFHTRSRVLTDTSPRPRSRSCIQIRITGSSRRRGGVMTAAVRSSAWPMCCCACLSSWDGIGSQPRGSGCARCSGGRAKRLVGGVAMRAPHVDAVPGRLAPERTPAVPARVWFGVVATARLRGGVSGHVASLSVRGAGSGVHFPKRSRRAARQMPGVCGISWFRANRTREVPHGRDRVRRLARRRHSV